jgi:hypothetical protein
MVLMQESRQLVLDLHVLVTVDDPVAVMSHPAATLITALDDDGTVEVYLPLLPYAVLSRFQALLDQWLQTPTYGLRVAEHTETIREWPPINATTDSWWTQPTPPVRP